jgi:von Willebrand factor type A domain-containing protein
MKSSGTFVAVALTVVAIGSGCDAGRGTLAGSGGGAVIPSGRGGAAMIPVGTAGAGLTGTGTAGGPGFECGAMDYPAPRVSPDIVILVDTSVSMNDPIDGPCTVGCESRSKWAAATAAISSVVGSTGTTMVNWGLGFISSGTDSCGTTAISLPVGAPAAAIRAALASRSNGTTLAGGGNRPTRAAVNVAATHLAGLASGPHRVILLVTDGAPNCMPSAPDFRADDTRGAVAAVTDALTNGITTAVVGLATGGGPADAALSEMATAGGRARAGSPAYYPASSSGDVMAAINELVTTAAACTFSIPPPPTTDGTTSRSNIQVMSNGRPIPQDANNGWTYTDATMTGLQFHGAACDEARVGSPVSISFLCLLF